MHRMIRPVAAAAVALALAGCNAGVASPSTWTFPPTGASGSSQPATAAPGTPTPPASPVSPATPTPTASPSPTPLILGTEDAPREIAVEMGNFLYSPASVTVHAGETIRFILSNPTTIMHEFVVGDAEAQEEHAKEMADGMHHDDHDHMASEPNEIEVEAGETAEFVWTFDEAGELLMGCHVAGHWDAGMVGAIEVVS